MTRGMLSETLSGPGKVLRPLAQLGREIQRHRAYDCPAHPARVFAFQHCALRPSEPAAVAGGRL